MHVEGVRVGVGGGLTIVVDKGWCGEMAMEREHETTAGEG
jgi:hypothetical protein